MNRLKGSCSCRMNRFSCSKAFGIFPPEETLFSREQENDTTAKQISHMKKSIASTPANPHIYSYCQFLYIF